MNAVTTREQVIEKLDDYLHHRLSTDGLVAWAEQVMMDGDLPESEGVALRDVVARLGVADVREFGLTWEECVRLVESLGYSAEVTLRPSGGSTAEPAA